MLLKLRGELLLQYFHCLHRYGPWCFDISWPLYLKLPGVYFFPAILWMYISRGILPSMSFLRLQDGPKTPKLIKLSLSSLHMICEHFYQHSGCLVNDYLKMNWKETHLFTLVHSDFYILALENSPVYTQQAQLHQAPLKITTFRPQTSESQS